MSELEQQLEQLRRRIAAASERAARQVEARLAERTQTLHTRLEEVITGEYVDTPHGRHFETERRWEHFRRHGNMDISRLIELPPDLLTEITEGTVTNAPPERWAFLDTETTGLAGGSGTCAFLVGIGRITPQGFHVRQYFMPDYPDEPSMLWAITAALEDVDVLVTYNGKTFDIPLLETRYRLARRPPPFTNLPHLDLLYGARRLWRLRFDSCRLMELEYQLLGHERHEEDIAGDLIPQIYFDYIRTGRALRLPGIFQHNACDILTLACLTGIVPWAFRDPSQIDAHGAELVSLGRWLRQSGRIDEASTLFRRAVDCHLPDALLFRTLWDLAEIEKKRNSRDAALGIYADLAAARNPFRIQALEELSKHYEHRERNYALALDFAEQAFAVEPSDDLQRRCDRLKKKAAAPQTARLL